MVPPGPPAAGNDSADPQPAAVQVDPVDGSTLETVTETPPQPDTSSGDGLANLVDEGSQFTDNKKSFMHTQNMFLTLDMTSSSSKHTDMRKLV